MSEINKVYKEYGDSAGHLYLTLLHSYLYSSAEFAKKNDSSFKSRFDRYVKQEYGNDFFHSFELFSKGNLLNTKLLDELNKKHGEFISKAILDLARLPDVPAPPKSVQSPASSVTRTPLRNPNAAFDKPVTNSSSTANNMVQQTINTQKQNKPRKITLSLEGMQANIDYDDPQKAIAIAKAATFMHPHSEINWCSLGDLYAEVKDWNTAYSYYEKSLNIKSQYSRALDGKARAESQIKELPERILQKKATVSDNPSSGINKVPAVEEDAFYFENDMEFLVYCKTKNNSRNVRWLSGENYLNEYKKGYQLIEQKQYAKAIEAFQNALKLNPVGVSARFEICTAYCQLHNIPAAKSTLQDVIPYLYSDKLIAKYYRSLGYILIEENKNRIAACCYQYSLYLDPDQPSAKQEILFIVNKEGFDVLEAIRNRNNVEKVLKDAGIALICIDKE